MNISKCYCGEEAYSKLYAAGDCTLVKCSGCQQVRVAAINVNKAFYDDDHYFTERNNYIERWEEFSLHFRKIIYKVKKFKSGGTLLDIGCGVGILLDVAQRNGFEVKGIELSRWASEFARDKGFDVITGNLLDTVYTERSFDVIVLNHVLEHLPNPRAILQEAKRILKDDGLLIIGAPNFDSYMAKIRKEKWFSLMPNQHIWQFTHETLSMLLQKNGFSVVYFEAKDNHAVGWRHPSGILFFLVNVFAVIFEKSEAMLVFARKS